MGQRDTRDADSRRSQKPIRLHHVSPAEKGHESPFWVVQKNLSHAALGHLGQRDTWDAKSRSGRRQRRKVNVWPMKLQTAITFDSELRFSQNWTFWNEHD
ncbi:hypothetical protein KI387_000821, partial [Taxus chinensis]